MRKLLLKQLQRGLSSFQATEVTSPALAADGGKMAENISTTVTRTRRLNAGRIHVTETEVNELGIVTRTYKLSRNTDASVFHQSLTLAEGEFKELLRLMLDV